jgi:hypothetical protein
VIPARRLAPLAAVLVSSPIGATGPSRDVTEVEIVAAWDDVDGDGVRDLLTVAREPTVSFQGRRIRGGGIDRDGDGAWEVAIATLESGRSRFAILSGTDLGVLESASPPFDFDLTRPMLVIPRGAGGADVLWAARGSFETFRGARQGTLCRWSGSDGTIRIVEMP